MTFSVQFALRAAIVCGVLQLLFGLFEIVVAPVLADAMVERIVRAETNDVAHWHSIAFETLQKHQTYCSVITIPLSVAIIVLVSFAFRFGRISEEEKKTTGDAQKNAQASNELET